MDVRIELLISSSLNQQLNSDTCSGGFSRHCGLISLDFTEGFFWGDFSHSWQRLPRKDINQRVGGIMIKIYYLKFVLFNIQSVVHTHERWVCKVAYFKKKKKKSMSSFFIY